MKLGKKLGAKKATTAINFEEAQRKALEEEERVKRLGYDKMREEEEAKAVKQREEEERRRAKAAGEQISRGSTPAAGARGSGADDSSAPKPAKLGFGQVVGAAPVVQAKPYVVLSSRIVVSCFGMSGRSSDMAMQKRGRRRRSATKAALRRLSRRSGQRR